jgi:hypothetical protein
MTEKDQDKEKKAHPEGREKHRPRRFPVVGVGASAGGLEALEQFISGLPEQSGIAFVIVTHTIRTIPPASRKFSDANLPSNSFLLMADRTGHDFSEYKKSTLIRRIERRMSVNCCNTFEDYLGYIYQNPEETRAVFKDLLKRMERNVWHKQEGS